MLDQRKELIEKKIRQLKEKDKALQLQEKFHEEQIKRAQNKLRYKKLLQAGEIIESVGLLDDYDEEKLRNLLIKHKAEILQE